MVPPEGELAEYVIDLSQVTFDKAKKSVPAPHVMPALPDGSSWLNLFDPDGLAVTTNLIGGRAVGFLVSGDYRWVDLAAVLALPTTGGFDAGQLEVADPSSAVTYLDAATAP